MNHVTMMNNFYNFSRFSAGDAIKFEFDGVCLEGIKLLPRTTMRAILLNPKFAIVRVEAASPELNILPLQSLGLATDTKIMPKPGVVAPMTLQKLVMPGGEFAYYDPIDIDPNRQDTVPLDRIHHLPATYGHIAINNTLLF